MAYLAGIVNTTGTTSATLTYPFDLLPGDRLVAVASGSNTQTFAASDGFNTFSILASVTTTPFLYTFSAPVTTLVPRGTTLSITWGGVTRNPAITLSIFRPDAGETLGTPVTTTAVSAATTTLSLTSATPAVAAGRIFLGTVSLGSSTATVTGDADTLGAAWSTRTTYTNATSNRTVAQQIKITSNPGAQTFNPTFTSTTAAGSLVVIPIDIKVNAISSSDAEIVANTEFKPTATAALESSADIKNYINFVLNPQDADSSSFAVFNPRLIMPITGESGNIVSGFGYSSGGINLSVVYNGRNQAGDDSGGYADITEVVYDLNPQSATDKSYANLRSETVYDLEPLSASADNTAVFNPKTLISPTDPPSVDLNTFGNTSGDINLSVAYNGRNRAVALSSGSADITEVVYDLNPQSATDKSYANLISGTVYDLEPLSASADNTARFNPNTRISPVDKTTERPQSLDYRWFNTSAVTPLTKAAFDAFFAAAPAGSGTVTGADLSNSINWLTIANKPAYITSTTNFAVEVSGYLVIDTPGTYTFNTISDDGNELQIGNKIVTSFYGARAVGVGDFSDPIELEVGKYPFRYRMQNTAGEAGAQINWQMPGVPYYSIMGKDSFVTSSVDKFSASTSSSGDINLSFTMSFRNFATNKSAASERFEVVSYPILGGSAKTNASVTARSNISLIENLSGKSFARLQEPNLRANEILYSSGRSVSGNINVLGTEVGPFIGWGMPL